MTGHGPQVDNLTLNSIKTNLLNCNVPGKVFGTRTNVVRGIALSLLSIQFYEVNMSEANYATYRYSIDILHIFELEPGAICF